MNSPWFDSDDPPSAEQRPPERRALPWGVPEGGEGLPPPPAPPPRPAWTMGDLRAGIGLVLLGFATVITVVTVIALRSDPETDPTSAFALAFVTLVFGFWLGAVVLILARRRGLSMHDLGFRPLHGSAAFWPVGTWLAGILIVTAYGLVVMLVESVTGDDLSRLVEGNPLPDTEATTPLVWAVLGVAVVVAAPLGEELFFRALVFRAVQARWGLVAGMVVSGALFALVHFEVSVVLPFWGIGMLFAWAYHRSGSLWTPVIAHAIFNGVSFAATISGIVS